MITTTNYTTSLDNTTSSEQLSNFLQEYNIPTEFLSFLGGFLLAFAFIFFVIVLVMYLFNSIGLQSLAKKAGYENTWIAWIPLASNYLYAKVSTKNIGLAWGYVLFTILAFFAKIPFEGTILLVLNVILAYNLFKRYSKNYIALTVITAITFGTALPIILFVIRKNDII